jgi:membrane-bound lytic murein transglycosylase A
MQRQRWTAPTLGFMLVLLAGCGTTRTATSNGPDYTRPLPPGAAALRRITDPSRYPDFAAAYRQRDAFVLDALDQSARWFAAPSSREFFPVTGITHAQAQASVIAFQDLLVNAPSESVFTGELNSLFDVYESVGYDGSGTVLFTGYYAGEFPASRERTPRFRHPLYTRPPDLVTDPRTGEPRGRRTRDGGTEPYPARREIEQSGMFAGTELAWLESPLDVYIVHVNGSAKLRLPDGSLMFVGYAGKTDRPYTGLGRLMVEEGLLRPDQLSLTAIKHYYRAHPERVHDLINRNESYVFFTEYSGGHWPAGSLGVRVTQETTLATDKKVYPRGGVVLVQTQAVNASHQKREFLRFMLDQDTGGAIRAPGRADIFMGIGPMAEILAGGQYAEGRLYYLFLKPQYIDRYAIAQRPAAPPRTPARPERSTGVIEK